VTNATIFLLCRWTNSLGNLSKSNQFLFWADATHELAILIMVVEIFGHDSEFIPDAKIRVVGQRPTSKSFSIHYDAAFCCLDVLIDKERNAGMYWKGQGLMSNIQQFGNFYGTVRKISFVHHLFKVCLVPRHFTCVTP
jgi:hypothetical protein